MSLRCSDVNNTESFWGAWSSKARRLFWVPLYLCKVSAVKGATFICSCWADNKPRGRCISFWRQCVQGRVVILVPMNPVTTCAHYMPMETNNKGLTETSIPKSPTIAFDHIMLNPPLTNCLWLLKSYLTFTKGLQLFPITNVIPPSVRSSHSQI